MTEEQARGGFKHSLATELKISRIPKKVVEEFTKYANAEFVGDYGMALRDIVEKATKIYPKLIELEGRINKLEAEKKE